MLVEEGHGSQFKQNGDSSTQDFCGIYLLKSDPVTLDVENVNIFPQIDWQIDSKNWNPSKRVATRTMFFIHIIFWNVEQGQNEGINWYSDVV